MCVCHHCPFGDPTAEDLVYCELEEVYYGVSENTVMCPMLQIMVLEQQEEI